MDGMNDGDNAALGRSVLTTLKPSGTSTMPASSTPIDSQAPGPAAVCRSRVTNALRSEVSRGGSRPSGARHAFLGNSFSSVSCEGGGVMSDTTISRPSEMMNDG